MATIGELLRTGTTRLSASGSESARLDAELLLGLGGRRRRTEVIATPRPMSGPTARLR